MQSVRFYIISCSIVQNKTAIYISHRLSSCAFCDKIAVFDNARLVEHGTHRELLGAGGKYSEQIGRAHV